MTRALFDSSVLFGAVNARDANHDVVLRLVKGVDGGTLPDAVVIEGVLAETLNGIHGRVSHEAAVDFDGIDGVTRLDTPVNPYEPKE